MEMLLLACAVFLATHFMPSTPLRGVLVKSLGQWGYTGLYSAIAFGMIGWMSWAYARAPIEPLWPGVRWLPTLVMPISFVLLACGLFANNPTIVGMYRLLRNADPARGDMRSLVFFGSFAVLASVGTLLMDRRKQQSLGENWARFAAVSSNLPFLAILQGRNTFKASEIGWRNPAIGLALYALFFWLHPLLFGIRAY